MTAFIGASGFRWLRRILEASQPSCRRIVILRDAQRYSVELSVQHVEWLQALNVEMRDYHLAHEAAAQRLLPIETLHAKIVCADERIAYVGSANWPAPGSEDTPLS